LAVTTEADARALISVFGALLAAFGFFYTGVREAVTAGTMAAPGNADPVKQRNARKEARAKVRKALWPGIVLLVSSLLVCVLMSVPLLDTVGQFDTEAPYSASKAALVALGSFWLVQAAFWTRQVVRTIYRLATWK
jgi:hypothetical protein